MIECFFQAEQASGIPVELLVAISYVESGLSPYAMNIRTSFDISDLLKGIPFKRTIYKGRYMYSVYPNSFETASFVLHLAESRNLSYDVGIMQINRGNIRWLKKQGLITAPIDLLDPCINIAVGSYILSKCINMYGWTKGIDCYNKGNKAKEWSVYVDRVSSVLRILVEED